MAIITPSALISAIKGRWNKDIFQMRKGVITRRRSGRPRQPRSSALVYQRMTMSYYAGRYWYLSSARKTAWNYYASCLPGTMTGVNAYCRNNPRLDHASYTTLSQIWDAPVVPDPPAATTGFALSYDSGNDRFVLSWSTPTTAVLYVQAFSSVMVGYDDSKFPGWKFFETKPGWNSPIYWDASAYPSGTYVRFKIRVINEDGEISGSSATLKEVKT